MLNSALKILERSWFPFYRLIYEITVAVQKDNQFTVLLIEA